MKSKEKVFDLADYGFNLLKKYQSSYKDAEFYFEFNEYLTIEVEENSIKHSEIGKEGGVSIRLIGGNGSLGFSFTNLLQESNIDTIIKDAFKMMQAGTGDSDFMDLPFPTKYPNVRAIYDPEIGVININDSTEYVSELIGICDKDEMVISQSADFSTNVLNRYIFNSNGIELHSKETTCHISSNVIVEDKIHKNSSFGFEYQSCRTLEEIKPNEVVRSAINKAKENLHRIKINSMRCPVILTPSGTISLILKPIASAINAEAFQHKRTFLVGLRGTKIGSDKFCIDDNALIDGAVGSSPFDAEGVPCMEKQIIKNGRFLKTGLLHNSYTANKEGIESTGNASRHSYSSIPGIGISNFILKPGAIKKQELIHNLDKGIILDYTGDKPNNSTGDFSGLILHGNLIESGQITNPLNETMIGINLLDLFANIEGISREYKVYGPYYAPYVKINDVQIIGSKS